SCRLLYIYIIYLILIMYIYIHLLFFLSLHDALPIFSLGLIVYMATHAGRLTRLTRTALALVLAGALGNGIDRLRLGYVIDFVHRSEEHTSELQSRENLVCRLLLEKKNLASLYNGNMI